MCIGYRPCDVIVRHLLCVLFFHNIQGKKLNKKWQYQAIVAFTATFAHQNKPCWKLLCIVELLLERWGWGDLLYKIALSDTQLREK